MTISRPARPVLVAALVIGVAACAEPAESGGTAGSPPARSEAAATEGLVLRVEQTGGFVTPTTIAARLPMVSVYADGRVFTEGPVPAIYPGPALPNVQVGEIDAAEVQALVDRALDAGVAESGDLGTPSVADAPSTRFTVVTTQETHVREVYALWEGSEDSGLTDEQTAARGELSHLLTALTEPAADSTPYEPEAVALVASPWVDPGDGLVQPEMSWPGPALPGEPTGGPPDVTCVTAGGAEAQAVLAAARDANAATPWVTGDGTRWSVAFRPLLPDETGCADLTD